VFVAAGRGLAAIHDTGLVHRDFKPHNVMVGADGRVRVTDFGLARLQPELERERQDVSIDTSADPTMSPGMLAETLATQTRTGALVGTPAYMSPEQWRGRNADARSDQFSYCVALYEALFDTRPFTGRTAAELCAAVCEGPLPSPPVGKVPRWVVRVVMRGLSRAPNERFVDMHALLAALVDTPGRRRNRRITGLVAAGFVVVGGGAYALARPADAPGCAEPERFATLWDAAAQADVKAILDAGYDAAALHVERWREEWRATQLGVCEAGTEAAQSVAAQAALECLHRRLSNMHTAIGVMRESGPSGAALVQMIDTMPSPTECADASLLLTTQPDHTTPLGRVLAAQLAEDIDRIEALRFAGRHDEAMAIAIAVCAKAEVDGDQAVRAIALLALGQLYSAHKDAELAHDALRAAAWAAEASGHVVVAVDAWTELIAVDGGQLERHEDGFFAAERAHAALYRLRDPSREFTLASHEALLRSMAGQYELALEGQRDVLARGLALYGAEHRQIARVHLNIAAVLGHLGRVDEAAEHAYQGLAIQRLLYPGPHPVTAEMLSSIGALEVQRGRKDAARAALDDGLAILAGVAGSSRATRATLLSNRATLDLESGNTQRGVDAFQEIVALRRELHGPTHPDVALAMHNLASALDKNGAYEASISQYREALAMRIATSGPDHPGTATTQHNLGTLLTKHGDVNEAIAMLERALATRDKANVDPWRRASTRFMLAKALERRGDRKAALARAEEARALLREIAPRHAEVAAALDEWVAELPPV
jgi:tetratricopeptide (TPR) repeat protein